MTRLIYADHSGAGDGSQVVFGWLTVPEQHWSGLLTRWLEFRGRLNSDYGIPTHVPLNAAALIGGHGRPSVRADVNRSASDRARVVRESLAELGSWSEVRTAALVSSTIPGVRDFAETRDATYGRLAQLLNVDLRGRNEFGLVFLTDPQPGYARAHRRLNLEKRHLLEAPLDASGSHIQFAQLADLIAWTTYQSLAQLPGRRLAWNWMHDFLPDHLVYTVDLWPAPPPDAAPVDLPDEASHDLESDAAVTDTHVGPADMNADPLVH